MYKTCLAMLVPLVLVSTMLAGGCRSGVGTPTGLQIAFGSYRDDSRDGNFEIYVMKVDGSGQTRLTNNAADDEWPSW